MKLYVFYNSTCNSPQVVKDYIQDLKLRYYSGIKPDISAINVGNRSKYPNWMIKYVNMATIKRTPQFILIN